MINCFEDRKKMIKNVKEKNQKYYKSEFLLDSEIKTEKKVKVPDDLYLKCQKCNRNNLKDDIIANHYICPNCDNHIRMQAYDRLDILVDKGTFKEVLKNKKSKNPIKMPGYKNKLATTIESTNMNEAVVVGVGKIMNYEYAIAIMDSHFLMGSMGTVVGEKITTIIEFATEKRLPLIIFSTSGGARMQEGMLSLVQMAKTSAAIGRHNKEGLLYISVLTDPTTGGVSASFSMLGDIIIAEPGALIGFAGPRVIEQTIKEKLPESFQSSEFLLEHGFLDMIVDRENLKSKIANLSELHGLIRK